MLQKTTINVKDKSNKAKKYTKNQGHSVKNIPPFLLL